MFCFSQRLLLLLLFPLLLETGRGKDRAAGVLGSARKSKFHGTFVVEERETDVLARTKSVLRVRGMSQGRVEMEERSSWMKCLETTPWVPFGCGAKRCPKLPDVKQTQLTSVWHQCRQPSPAQSSLQGMPWMSSGSGATALGTESARGTGLT